MIHDSNHLLHIQFYSIFAIACFVSWSTGIRASSATDSIDEYLHIPYRVDGALNQHNLYTTFSTPTITYRSAGLNCSGLTIAIVRRLSQTTLSLSEATHDRLNDSGPNSPRGQDWDFGWDLVTNLSQQSHAYFLGPQGRKPIDTNTENRMSALQNRGFDLFDRTAWKRVLKTFRPDHFAVATISRYRRRGHQKRQLEHYHVGVLVPGENGIVWFYHSTRRAHAHRINLTSAKGLRRFLWQFGEGRAHSAKKILIIEKKIAQTN